MNVQPGTAKKRTASLFRNGRNQAVRIPREFEFESEEVEIEQLEDGSLVIRTSKPKFGTAAALAAHLQKMEPLPEEDQFPEIEDFPPEVVELDFDGNL